MKLGIKYVFFSFLWFCLGSQPSQKENRNDDPSLEEVSCHLIVVPRGWRKWGEKSARDNSSACLASPRVFAHQISAFPSLFFFHVVQFVKCRWIFVELMGWRYERLHRQVGYPTYLGSPPLCKEALKVMSHGTIRNDDFKHNAAVATLLRPCFSWLQHCFNIVLR